MPDLTPADRVVALLEWGDVAEVDGLLAEADDGPGAWQPVLWRAMRALMDGRFQTCERLVAEAAARGQQAGEPRAGMLAALLLVALRREQERPAEAEALLRSLLDRHPSAPPGAHALLALLVGEMGRDGQARRELARLVPREPVPAARVGPLYLLAELAASVSAPDDELELLERRLQPHGRDFAVEDGGAVFYGSVAMALARLAQARGRWDDAVQRYHEAIEAHSAVGAPLLLAHAQRHLAALLRARGDEGDWEEAVDQLSSAVVIYRKLAVDGRASDSQAVLARSEDGLGRGARAPEPTETTLFRREGDVWLVGPERDPARMRHAAGLQDIARLLAAPHRSVHVTDLLAGDRRTGVPALAPAPPYRPWATGALRPWVVDGPILDADTRREYEARLTELAGELVEAEHAGDAIAAALARAERDALADTLAGRDQSGAVDPVDPVDRARRAVGARIRIALDHIEQAQPGVGRHLRTSIRTGTFFAYDPDQRLRWAL